MLYCSRNMREYNFEERINISFSMKAGKRSVKRCPFLNDSLCTCFEEIECFQVAQEVWGMARSVYHKDKLSICMFIWKCCKGHENPFGKKNNRTIAWQMDYLSRQCTWWVRSSRVSFWESHYKMGHPIYSPNIAPVMCLF